MSVGDITWYYRGFVCCRRGSNYNGDTIYFAIRDREGLTGPENAGDNDAYLTDSGEFVDIDDIATGLYTGNVRFHEASKLEETIDSFYADRDLFIV